MKYNTRPEYNHILLMTLDIVRIYQARAFTNKDFKIYSVSEQDILSFPMKNRAHVFGLIMETKQRRTLVRFGFTLAMSNLYFIVKCP